MSTPGAFRWKRVLLLDADFDSSADLSNLINTPSGAVRAAPYRSNEYRRRRKSEDGYDELDFA
ncbi:hypothetical protein I6F34_01440 [Bradyrhizobium sp. BRP05]|nr:hypothetical protein [Bradyrhizobium sp. BRP05]